MTDDAKWILHPQDSDENRLVPVFRRRFEVKPDLANATLRLTAHGLYEAELNGKPITDHKFSPGQTSYYHRIQVQAYDVTALPHEDENLWRTTVGDGCCQMGQRNRHHHALSLPSLCAGIAGHWPP